MQVFWHMDFQSMKYLQAVKTYCNLVLKKTLNETFDAYELFNIWYIKILVFKF